MLDTREWWLCDASIGRVTGLPHACAVPADFNMVNFCFTLLLLWALVYLVERLQYNRAGLLEL